MTWVIPGSPLRSGKGWRVWFALPPGSSESDLGPFQITPLDQNTQWNVSPDLQGPFELPGLSRYIWMGEVSFEDASPNTLYDVYIPVIDETKTWRTLPLGIPAEGLNVLFASCFWLGGDKEGYYQSALEKVIREAHPTPAFKMLLGDQVYLDWPWQWSGPYEEQIGARYSEYWGSKPYRDALLTTPNFFMCDDHEFWNDFPEFQIQITHTWNEEQRSQYGELADRYYQYFQRFLNPEGQTNTWFSFDIPPVSFFVADTRSRRSPVENPERHFLSEDEWEALETWQKQLAGPGILALGQPFFQKDGNWKDHSLSNFPEDYERLKRIIEQSLQGENDQQEPHDILLVSGDIHTGRHARAFVPGEPHDEVHEMIASPASRIVPYLSEPEPVETPTQIPPSPHSLGSTSGIGRWRVETTEPGPDASSNSNPTVNNNLGLLSLFRSEKDPYSLRVRFQLYNIRPPRMPWWKFWKLGELKPVEQTRHRVLYTKEIYLK